MFILSVCFEPVTSNLLISNGKYKWINIFKCYSFAIAIEIVLVAQMYTFSISIPSECELIKYVWVIEWYCTVVLKYRRKFTGNNCPDHAQHLPHSNFGHRIFMVFKFIFWCFRFIKFSSREKLFICFIKTGHLKSLKKKLNTSSVDVKLLNTIWLIWMK